MKNYRRIIIVLLLSVLSFSTHAQYKKLLKNEKNPFDTAVAIDIKVYRQESKKLEVCDNIVASHNEELSFLREQVIDGDSIILIQNKELILNSQSINQLVNQLKESEESNKKWYRNPTLYLILGLVGGFFIAK